MTPYELAGAIRLAAEKMPCSKCGAMPCEVVFVRVKHGAPEPRTREDLVVEPGYCRKHVPQRLKGAGAKRA